MFRAHFLLFFLLSSAFASGQKAEFFFQEPFHRFAKTPEGTQLSYDYKFINKGSAPLIITGSKVNCACTRVTFPLHPVMPGDSGIVHVSFDTKGKAGYHDRIIELTSNASDSPARLRFKVFVQKKR